MVNSLFAISILALLSWIVYLYNTNAVLNVWDEALYANNALEMKQNGNLITYYSYGHIDHHNSKPPLVIWLQALSFFVFGFTEFAVRFPSYLAIVGIILTITWFSKKVLSNTSIGLLAGLFILTSKTLMRRHVFLTGDLDAVLVFFTTAFMLYSFYLAQANFSRYTSKHYWTFFTLLLLGWLTKSTAIFLVLPTILFPFLYFRKFKLFFLKKSFLWVVLSLLLSISSYYFIREYLSPGYFKFVWNSEILRLVKNPQSWLEYERLHYYNELKDTHFTEYFYGILILGLTTIFIPKLRWKSTAYILFSMPLIYLITISIPDSKMFWYAAPAFPILCLVLAIFCGSLFYFFISLFKSSNLLISSILFIILAVVLIYQSFKIIDFTIADKDNAYTLEYEIYALKQFEKTTPAKNSYILYRNIDTNLLHHLDVLEFYRRAYQIKGKMNLQIASTLRKNDVAIVSQQDCLDSLQSKYTYQVLDSCHYGKLIKVLANKD